MMVWSMLRTSWSSATTSPALGTTYNIFDDINGDGVVNISDTNLVGRFIGKTLPKLPPLDATGSSAPALAGERRSRSATRL